jgi:hypothetical protein
MQCRRAELSIGGGLPGRPLRAIGVRLGFPRFFGSELGINSFSLIWVGSLLEGWRGRFLIMATGGRISSGERASDSGSHDCPSPRRSAIQPTVIVVSSARSRFKSPIDNASVATLPLGKRGNLTTEAACRRFGSLTGFDD